MDSPRNVSDMRLLILERKMPVRAKKTLVVNASLIAKNFDISAARAEPDLTAHSSALRRGRTSRR